jgi:N4-gp56 family major capsid protein
MTTVVQDTSNYALVKESVALTAVAIKAPTDLTPLIGKAPTQSGAESIVKQQSSPGLPGVLVTDLSAKKTGTMVTIEAYDTLGGDPIMGDQMREGKGENVDISSMDAKIDLASKVINAVPGTMIDQRTKINLRSMAMAQLMGYFPRLLWNRTLVHLAGARGEQIGKSWHIKTVAQSSAGDFASKMINPVLAPTYNRHYVINGSDLTQGGAQLASIASTDVWKLNVVDALVELLDSLEFKLQPIRIPGDPAANYSPIKGVLYMDPVAYSMLKRDTTSGNNIRAWQAAAMERGALMGANRHPLFMGEVGLWNGILIRPMEHAIVFTAGSTCKHITSANRYTATETDVTVNGSLTAGFRVSRSILMGAQAFAVIQGNNTSSGTTASFKERTYDYDSKHEAMGEWMGGETKLRFSFRDANGNLEPTDHGVMVIDAAVRTVGN